MEDFPSLGLGGDETTWCDGCQRRQKLIDQHEQEKSLNYKTLKQKIVSTDLLIKKFRSKCEEYDQQSKMLEDVTRKLERAKRDTETLDNQLQNSLRQMEPLRNENDSLKGVLSKKEVEIEMWKTKVFAADKLRSQYEAFGKQNDLLKSKLERHEKERKSFDKKMDSLETSKQKVEKDLSSFKVTSKILKQENRSLEKKLEKTLQIQQQHLNLLQQNDLLTKSDKRLRNSLVKQNQCIEDDYMECTPFDSSDQSDADRSFKESDLDLMFTMSPLVNPLSPLPPTPLSNLAEENNDSLNDWDMVEIQASDIGQTALTSSTSHNSPSKQLLSQSINQPISQVTPETSKLLPKQCSTTQLHETLVSHIPFVQHKERHDITHNTTIISDATKTTLVQSLETELIAKPLPFEDQATAKTADKTQSSLDNEAMTTVLQTPEAVPHSIHLQNLKNNTVLIPLKETSLPLLIKAEQKYSSEVIKIAIQEYDELSPKLKQTTERSEIKPCVTTNEHPTNDSESQNPTTKTTQDVELVNENWDQHKRSSNTCTKPSQLGISHIYEDKSPLVVPHSQVISTIKVQSLSLNDKAKLVQDDFSDLNESSIILLKSEPITLTDKIDPSVENCSISTSESQAASQNIADTNGEPLVKQEPLLPISIVSDTQHTNLAIDSHEIEYVELKTETLSDLPNKTEPVALNLVPTEQQSEAFPNKLETLLKDEADSQPDKIGEVGNLECPQDQFGMNAVMPLITIENTPKQSASLDSFDSVKSKNTQICLQSKSLSSFEVSKGDNIAQTQFFSEVIVIEDDIIQNEKQPSVVCNELTPQPSNDICSNNVEFQSACLNGRGDHTSEETSTTEVEQHCMVDQESASGENKHQEESQTLNATEDTETTLLTQNMEIKLAKVEQHCMVDQESASGENKHQEESQTLNATEDTETTLLTQNMEIKLTNNIFQASLRLDNDLAEISLSSNSGDLLNSENNEQTTSIIHNSTKKKKKSAKKRKRREEEISTIQNNDTSNNQNNSNSLPVFPNKAKKMKIPTFSDPLESSKSAVKQVITSQKSTGFTITERADDKFICDNFTGDYPEPSCSKKSTSECDILEIVFKSGDVIPNIRPYPKIDSSGNISGMLNSPSLCTSPFNFLDIMNPISPLPPSPEPPPSDEINFDDACPPSLEDFEQQNVCDITHPSDIKSRLLNSALLPQPVRQNRSRHRITMTTRPMDPNTSFSAFSNSITVPHQLENNETLLKKDQISIPTAASDSEPPIKSDLVIHNVLRRSKRTKSRDIVKAIETCDKNDSSNSPMEVENSSVCSRNVTKDEESEKTVTNVPPKLKLISKNIIPDDLPVLCSSQETESHQSMECELENVMTTGSEEMDSFILKNFKHKPLQNWFLLVQTILNVLKKTQSVLTSRSSEDVNSNHTKTDTHQPLLFHTETNLLVLLQNIFSQYSICSDSVLLNLLLTSVIKEGLNLAAKAAMCRIFIGLCRLKGDIEQGRVLAYEIIFHTCACNNENGPMLVFAMAGVWPIIFDSKFPIASVIVPVMEHVVMTITAGYRYSQAKIFNSISEICGWRLVLPAKNNKLMCENVIKYLRQASDQKQSHFKGNVFEGMAALKLLFKNENWHFFFIEFINRHVSSACQKWTSKAENSDMTLQYIECILNVLGDVNIVEKEPEVHKINMLMKLYLMPTLNKPSKLKSVSLTAANTMMKLSPLAPQITCSYLMTWFRKHKDEIPEEIKIRLQHTRQYLLDNFSNFNCAEFV